MKEAYFEGMEWTKTFVSGPVDPDGTGTRFIANFARTIIPSTVEGPAKFYAIMPLNATLGTIRNDGMNIWVPKIR